MVARATDFTDWMDVVRIDFEVDSFGTYRRLELPSGSRLETNGAVHYCSCG